MINLFRLTKNHIKSGSTAASRRSVFAGQVNFQWLELTVNAVKHQFCSSTGIELPQEAAQVAAAVLAWNHPEAIH